MSLTKFIIENFRLKNVNNFIISAFLFHASFESLTLKKITQDTVLNLFAYLSIISKLVVLSSVKPENNDFIKTLNNCENPGILKTSFTETVFRVLLNEKPEPENIKEFSTLIGITQTKKKCRQSNDSGT